LFERADYVKNSWPFFYKRWWYISLRILKKGSNIRLSKHLNQREIDCNCEDIRCHYTLIDERVIQLFEKLREAVGYPIYISSGFRCQKYNEHEKVLGTARSKHTMGYAIDIRPKEGTQFFNLLRAAEKIFPFVLEYKNDYFIHCDIRKGSMEG